MLWTTSWLNSQRCRFRRTETDDNNSRKITAPGSTSTATSKFIALLLLLSTVLLLFLALLAVNASEAQSQSMNKTAGSLLSRKLLREAKLRRSPRSSPPVLPTESGVTCLVQFVERRSCRPISAPVDWDEIIDDSSQSVEATDSAELRYNQAGYNAPTLRLTPYNDDPFDESTYFIERHVPGKPGVFTLQTLSTREYICVSRRGRIRLKQAPLSKKRCWWVAGRVAFGAYGQQRHSMALLSARHFPSNTVSTRVEPVTIKLQSAKNLTNFWVVAFRRDGRPLPAFAPKVLLLPNSDVDQLAVDTFFFTRIVASHATHEAHNFIAGSCREALQRHNNYARHLTFCQQ